MFFSMATPFYVLKFASLPQIPPKYANIFKPQLHLTTKKLRLWTYYRPA